MASRSETSERHPITRVDNDDRIMVGALLLAMAATVIMLQATRVFLSYMVFIIDQSERVQLGATAGAVYLAVGLGALVPRVTGIRRSLTTIAIALVAVRLAMQFVDVPELRMWLGAGTIVLCGWLLPLVMTVARSAAAFGIGLGLVLDVGIRFGRNSVDVPLMPTASANVVTILLLLVVITGMFLLTRGDLTVGSPCTPVSALAFGPALALQHLTIGNLGALDLRLATSDVMSTALLTAGLIAGLAIDLFLVRRARNRQVLSILVGAMVVAGGTGLWMYWQSTGAGIAFGVVIGSAATTALIISALRGGKGRASVSSTALWLTLGLLLHAIILFAYFTATGWPLLIVILFGFVALVAVTPIMRPMLERDTSWSLISAHGGVTAALVIAIVVSSAGSRHRGLSEPLPDTFTIMTYNIQSGFSRDNHWSLEETARVIEAADADVVILQEVGRAWPILSAVDQAAWLADRLRMELIWGPASQDDLWGNAILTNAPILSTDWVKYDTTENLRRGAVLAELETVNGSVTIIGTHLDNPGSATGARQEQITQLLEFHDGSAPAVIAGDLNADPGSEALLAIEAAGFTDSGAELPANSYTSEDDRRIDYVLVSGGLETVEIDIPDTWASGHKPVVVTLRLP